ncbi:hypothetical protein HID58_074036, partial [Brassica napus]
PMFGLPSRSQTDETMIDVVKSKDSQEQHEPVKDNTCDDKLHPGAAMTTEVTRKELVSRSPLRKDLFKEGEENHCKVSDVSMELKVE